MAETYGRNSGHMYPSIHISGNARVILGDVYGLSEDFLESAVHSRSKNEVVEELASLPDFTDGNVNVLTARLASLVVREFKDVKSTIYKAQKHNTQLRSYAREIFIKKKIVQNHILHLIRGHVESEETASQMIKHSKHPTWFDAEFLVYLGGRLGDNQAAVNKTLELISLNMDALSSFLSKCYDLFDTSEQVSGSLLTKAARNDQLATLLRTEGLVNHVSKLKENISDLRILIDQSDKRKQDSYATVPSSRTKLKLGRFRTIQEAATDLHKSFALACIEHSSHQTRLKMLADDVDRQKVEFSLFLEQNRTLPSLSSEALILKLNIQSELTGSITPAEVSGPFRTPVPATSRAGKRQLETEEDPQITSQTSWNTPQKKVFGQKKTVGFATMAYIPTSQIYPNFCTHRDFCMHVKQAVRQGCCKDRPLGYMSSPGCSKHMIYLTSYTETQTLSYGTPKADGSVSFTQWHASGAGRLTKLEILSLSKQLAMGLLQYHATPWLEESWDSDHILIERKALKGSASSENAQQRSDPIDPYLDVSIRNYNDPERTPIDTRSRTLIREWTLFSFGVMLLELAYRQPIKQKRIDRDLDPNEHNTNYYTAERLQRSVSEEMGPAYAEIIRKCIQCDFGEGADLRRSKLQECFYEDVVQKLEDLQTRLLSLDLGAL